MNLHDGPDIDPDARDDVEYSWVEKNISQYIKRHLLGVETEPSIVEHCIYTVKFSYLRCLNHPTPWLRASASVAKLSISFSVKSLL